ncbi:hypothetical protein SLS60_012086 [Paraconiothyrium brasiliense]|uniref:Uncharacterized protein n=1 Tax=Paraconiothyrium brasiliense TaxID=300254 RepID=A0ABR3QHM1_9PLEO
MARAGGSFLAAGDQLGVSGDPGGAKCVEYNGEAEDDKDGEDDSKEGEPEGDHEEEYDEDREVEGPRRGSRRARIDWSF